MFDLGALTALLSAAAGISLLRLACPPLRRIGCRLVCVALGLALGCYSLVSRERESASLGIPSGEVTSYVVTLGDDTSVSADGRLLSRGFLVSVGSKDGTRSSARGAILLSGGSKRFLWGTKIHVNGRIQRAGSGGVDWIGTIRSSEQLGCRGYFRLRARARDWVRMRVERLRPDDAGLFMALLLGVRDDLGNAESFFFRRAGAVHLLALSGFHLGILSLILVAFLSPFLGKRRAIIAAALVLFGYLFIAGPKVSLLRAMIMFTLLGLCKRAGVRARGLDVLGLTFFANALLWPRSLSSLSFQLSYLALVGIMVAGTVIDRTLVSVVPKLIRLPFAASFGALAATAPTLVARFGLLYPVGLVSGLILTPLVTAFVWVGLGVVFLPIPSTFSEIASSGLHLLHQLLLSCAELCSRGRALRISDWRGVSLGSGIVFAMTRLPSLINYLRQVQEPGEAQEGP